MDFKHGDRVTYPKLGEGTFKHYETDKSISAVEFVISDDDSVIMSVKTKLLKKAILEKEIVEEKEFAF